MIDVEFGKKDHSSIPPTAIGRKLKPIDVRIDPKPDSTDGKSKNKIGLYMLCKQI
jgi:hypothetical protein